MASTPTGVAGISALIQIQAGSANASSLNSLRSLQSTNQISPVKADNNAQQQDSIEYQKAQDAANKFEALMIHNMLKTMRKTTMSENTSNQKAMYDDMLDQKLADTMVEAGGLGVAKQLISQLQSNLDIDNKQTAPAVVNEKLRALLRDKPATVQGTTDRQEKISVDATRLRLASELWGTDANDRNQTPQQEFLAPLKPLARETAQRIGTTTNAVLAIAALETGWGRSMITDESGQSTHNYFGIKAIGSDSQYTRNTTTEYLQGKPQIVQARFKSYSDPADGMKGFADSILNNPRYSDALKHASEPERFLAEIHKAGYATDPNYSKKAISILHQINSQAPLL